MPYTSCQGSYVSPFQFKGPAVFSRQVVGSRLPTSFSLRFSTAETFSCATIPCDQLPAKSRRRSARRKFLGAAYPTKVNLLPCMTLTSGRITHRVWGGSRSTTSLVLVKALLLAYKLSITEWRQGDLLIQGRRIRTAPIPAGMATKRQEHSRSSRRACPRLGLQVPFSLVSPCSCSIRLVGSTLHMGAT